MAQNVTIAGASYSDVPAVQLPKTGGGSAMFYDASGIDYASSPTSGGNADKTNAILYGTVDSTSTSTAYTATVDGLTELVDGTAVLLKNGVVTSAANFTINVNNLGAKPVYSNMAAATRETTIFNANYTLLFIYDSTRVDGGCWVNYRGYYSDANTIGYQLRTNSGTLPTTAKFYRYRILFTSADGTHWVPSNTSTSTNATAKRDVNQTPINPFGPIVYYGTTAAVEANANVSAAQLWQQYAVTFGYSFNRTGAALVLSYPAPIYIKCAPQANGSAIIDADTPYVQALPSSKDGKIYIFLGIAYSATAVEVRAEHPIYWHDGTGIRLWTGAESGGGSSLVVPTYTFDETTGNITCDMTFAEVLAAVQTGTCVSAVVEVGIYVQSLIVDTYNNSQIWFKYTNVDDGVAIDEMSIEHNSSGISYDVDSLVLPSPSSTAPSMDGTASAGSSSDYAREDHVHPTDTSRQATLVSGTNIKTINSTSLLGSGDIAIAGLPSVTASDNGKVLQVSNGAWAAATPSGGGIGYATETVTLTASGWSPGLVGYSNIATSTICTDPDQDVIVAPKANAQADSPTNAWAQYGVRCVSVGVGFLEFAANGLPTSDIYVNVMAFDY